MTQLDPLRSALPLALLALTACGDPVDDKPETEETMVPVEPDDGIGDGAGPPGAVENAAIPMSFLGVWDYVEGACDPASDMRLEISENRMQFYESVGTVSEVREDDGTTYVDLAMTGEGESWTTTLGLRLVDAGTGLIVISPEAPGDAEKYLRKRCDV